MPVNYANFVGETGFDGSSFTANNKVYIRSSAAGDAHDFLIAGKKNSDSTATAETLTSISSGGKIERLNSDALADIHLVSYRNSGTETALTGTAQIRMNNGTAASGTITILAQPADSDTLIIGLTGVSTKTFTWETGTPSSNGQVKSNSTLSECAANLASAINDSAHSGATSGGEGTAWTNTDGANPYLTASASGNTVTVTDKINCARSLGWTTTASDATKVSVSAIRGGIDGTLIGSISAGLKSASTSVTSGVNLESEDQATNTLPGGLTGTSSSISVRGKFAVDIRTGTPNGAVNGGIQVSNDNTNWRTVPTTTITNLASDQDQQLNGDDLFGEYARLNITANAATSGTIANIAFISQR